MNFQDLGYSMTKQSGLILVLFYSLNELLIGNLSNSNRPKLSVNLQALVDSNSILVDIDVPFPSAFYEIYPKPIGSVNLECQFAIHAIS